MWRLVNLEASISRHSNLQKQKCGDSDYEPMHELEDPDYKDDDDEDERMEGGLALRLKNPLSQEAKPAHGAGEDMMDKEGEVLLPYRPRQA